MTPHGELDQLSAYLDGELDPSDRAHLEAHLPTCAECRTTIDALRATVADLAALPDPEPSEQDSWALRAAIAAEGSQQPGTAPIPPGRPLSATAVPSGSAPSAEIDRCVGIVKSSTQEILTPVRYELVTFESKPAFFLFFSTTDRYELWVVTRDTCDVAYFFQTH